VSNKSLTIQSYKNQYNVFFCDDGAQHLLDNLPKNCNFHLIMDKQVSLLYKEQFSKLFDNYSVLIIEAQEKNKSLESLPIYVSQLVKNKIRKNDVLIAVGGGIIQDITCFLSATLLRGLKWYFYPTTLLSQADSCIGSKSSINSGDSKNLLGTFTPPAKVIIGKNFLKTLEQKDLRSGVGEKLKVHGIEGPVSFDDIASNYDKLFLDDNSMMLYIIQSLTIKKKYIEMDEFDEGPRNIFNYGHSFGHAIESATDFLIPHGIAVTIGMDMANWLSPQIGSGDFNHYSRMHEVLAKNYRGYEDVYIPLEPFISAISKDKKNLGEDTLSLILPNIDAVIEKGVYKNDDLFGHLSQKYLNEIRFQ